MAGKGKRTFWLAPTITALHEERRELLCKNGFDCKIVTTIQALLAESEQGRATCIMIDANVNDHSQDHQQEHTAEVQLLQTLSQMPELNGVRFILSIGHYAPDAMKMAVSENFRDMIPMTLPNANWLQRVQYASSNQSTDFVSPLCEISLNQIAVIEAPARLTWINETHLCIECRGGQKIGSSLQITGPIAKAMDLPHLSLTVEQIYRESLVYRFSQALVCRWRVPASHTAKCAQMIQRIHTENSVPRVRSYLAITRADVRKLVVAGLNPEQFEIKIGLQRATLSDDISYFSPDVIFFDDRILTTLKEEEIKAIVAKLSVTTPVVVYGTLVPREKLKEMFGTRQIYNEPAVIDDQLKNAPHRYRIISQSREKQAQFGERITSIAPNHAWSRVDLHISARLSSINPLVGKVSLPFALGPFAIAKIEAPLLRRALGRDPYIKVIDSAEVKSKLHPSQFNCRCYFYLVDITPAEQIKLSQVLTTIVADYYRGQFSSQFSSQTEALEIALKMASSVDIPQNLGVAPSLTGNLALKQPFGPTMPDGSLHDKTKANFDSNETSSRATIKQARASRNFEINIDLNAIKQYFLQFDPTIVKAIGVFLIAVAVMLGIFHFAMNIDESYYKDDGREYSDFFRRMSDPEFRKTHPVPSTKPSPTNNRGESN